MSEKSEWERRDQWEGRSESGKPMVPATPRDVVHIRVGSFILVFAFAFGVLGIISQAYGLTVIAALAAVITIVDIVLAVRRQRDRNVGEAG
ncbi:hypothetical protein [Nonomuraea cavernae]|uniref:Uncharacterized protein n=1 Tax=Nonomuraea cavernae TaxID=2045107 RepID=A0A917YS48_9ACTN|nr:hypothetical protein [Nonomuraea cavernae]MCA2185094.1 hypothetical protein [Nonomuraea cavernae]GGO65393.1 hypothetical protein GCM10012289_16980 [Nonomuraea cavernae]